MICFIACQWLNLDFALFRDTGIRTGLEWRGVGGLDPHPRWPLEFKLAENCVRWTLMLLLEHLPAVRELQLPAAVTNS